MNVTFIRGEKIEIDFGEGRIVILTWEEWMDLRRMQNRLIRTEPND